MVIAIDVVVQFFPWFSFFFVNQWNIFKQVLFFSKPVNFFFKSVQFLYQFFISCMNMGFIFMGFSRKFGKFSNHYPTHPPNNFYFIPPLLTTLLPQFLPSYLTLDSHIFFYFLFFGFGTFQELNYWLLDLFGFVVSSSPRKQPLPACQFL